MIPFQESPAAHEFPENKTSLPGNEWKETNCPRHQWNKARSRPDSRIRLPQSPVWYWSSETRQKTETDNPGYCICCKKAIYTLFFLSRNQNVIDSPKQITSKIDYQCPGYERDPLIQHSLNIVMISPGCNPSGTIICQ